MIRVVITGPPSGTGYLPYKIESWALGRPQFVGVSRVPLLDACRQLQQAGMMNDTVVGLFDQDADRDEWLQRTTVGYGARYGAAAPVRAGAVVVNANLPLFPWTVLAMRSSLDTHEAQQFPVYVIGQAEVMASVVFKARERVEFASQTVELNHLNVSGTTPQGQPISMDFWVNDDRKIIKMSVPSQGVEAFQDGFEPKAPAAGTQQTAPKG